MQPERGDIVRSSDPFKLGTDNQRPWLIVNDDRIKRLEEIFIILPRTPEFRVSNYVHTSGIHQIAKAEMTRTAGSVTTNPTFAICGIVI